MFRLDIGMSFGNWRYTDDASGTYRDSDGNDQSYNYSLKDLKVGDMPQNSLSFGLTATPVEGSAVQLTYRYYDAHFSSWDPTSREYSDGDPIDRKSVWQAPSYGVMDLNASYNLPFDLGGSRSASVVLNVRNLLDEVYVQDALDNSRYNAYPFRINDHNAHAAEVYLGMPTSYNLGLRINF